MAGTSSGAGSDWLISETSTRHVLRAAADRIVSRANICRPRYAAHTPRLLTGSVEIPLTGHTGVILCSNYCVFEKAPWPLSMATFRGPTSETPRGCRGGGGVLFVDTGVIFCSNYYVFEKGSSAHILWDSQKNTELYKCIRSSELQQQNFMAVPFSDRHHRVP